MSEKEERRIKKLQNEREKKAAEEGDRIRAGHHPDWFTRQLQGQGKWYAQVEAGAKEEPKTREERRHALLESLGGSIERKVKKFAGTDTKRWAWGLGYESDERLSEFWIIANRAVCEYLDQEESGNLPEGLQGVEPEKAVAMKFEYKSRGWYDSKKKLDRIVLGGRGLGGEEKHLRQRALEGDPVALKRLQWLQRQIRKMNREGKRWLLARASGWRLPLVPKNILVRADVVAQVEDGNPRHLRFEFVRGAELEALVGQYSAGIAEVNAVEFAEALSEVRSHVWRAKDKLRRGEAEWQTK